MSALPLRLFLRITLSVAPSLFAGARGFHQLFRNYVARVSQLQGELHAWPRVAVLHVVLRVGDLHGCGMLDGGGCPLCTPAVLLKLK